MKESTECKRDQTCLLHQFIAINFIAIALAFKKWEQSLHGNRGPMLIRFQYNILESTYLLQ